MNIEIGEVLQYKYQGTSGYGGTYEYVVIGIGKNSVFAKPFGKDTIVRISTDLIENGDYKRTGEKIKNI